jgi:hypothetical protein
MSEQHKEPMQIDGSLVYRLTAPDGCNCDEINVSMWQGSRKDADRAEGARRVMACLDACAKIRTDLLKTGVGVFQILQGVAGERDQLQAALSATVEQRDVALAALKALFAATEAVRTSELPRADAMRMHAAEAQAHAAISSIERTTESEGEKG